MVCADFISTHALTEGDFLAGKWGNNPQRFQLTPSRRATMAASIKKIRPDNFNSRPHGGRPSNKQKVCHCYYFNSRPHGGRRVPSRSPSNKDLISTHALTEGDFRRSPASRRSSISTHALTEGDVLSMIHYNILKTFQLTPSRRATSEHGSPLSIALFISTHALTEGDSSFSITSSI